MSYPGTSVPVLHVGTDRYLLCDSAIIAEASELVWTVNPPIAVDTVMWPDQEWENLSLSYFSLLDDDGLLRMWYGAYEGLPVQRRICYAESVDGLNWVKPSLGLVEHGGSFDNNILPITVSDGGYVFVDPLAAPSSKYKFLGTGPFPMLFESPDGLEWTLVDSALLDLVPDSHNLVFYDNQIGSYVAYLRSWNMIEEYDSLAQPWRTVSRLEIADVASFWDYTPIDSPFYRWGPGKPPAISNEFDVIMAPDTLDPPEMDIYNPSVVRYEDAANAYFAFPSIYHHYPPPPVGEFNNDGVLNIQLGYSRDGITWSRYRTEYLDNDCFGDSLRQIYLAPSIIRMGNSLYQYFNGLEESHGDSVKTSHYFCVKQRVDGFLSLRASSSPAFLRTVPLTFEGNSLNLNYAVNPGGYVAVGLFDPGGNPLPGFGFDDCDTLRGDKISGPVSWSGIRNIEIYEGTQLSMGLEMREAELFAFQFKLDPSLDVSSGPLLARSWSLEQNYPNPFNPSTMIEFALPRRVAVKMTVYNVLGQEVRTLVDGPLSAGQHKVAWDGVDSHGTGVAGGVYFYRLVADDFSETRKMVLLR